MATTTTAAPVPVEIRCAPREPVDGLTVSSVEYGLPGPIRNLLWAIVADDRADTIVHALYDVAADDGEATVRDLLRRAPSVLGRRLGSGIWAWTVGDMADASVGAFLG
jgi:hypothetical protein